MNEPLTPEQWVQLGLDALKQAGQSKDDGIEANQHWALVNAMAYGFYEKGEDLDKIKFLLYNVACFCKKMNNWKAEEDQQNYNAELRTDWDLWNLAEKLMKDHRYDDVLAMCARMKEGIMQELRAQNKENK